MSFGVVRVYYSFVGFHAVFQRHEEHSVLVLIYYNEQQQDKIDGRGCVNCADQIEKIEDIHETLPGIVRDSFKVGNEYQVVTASELKNLQKK